MSGRVFVDTNVLVYAHDVSTRPKHERARSLVERLWQERTGAVSTQVLQELYVSLRRKAGRPLASEEAAAVVADYLRWEVVVNSGDSVLDAIALEQRYGISFWDALVLQSARACGAEVLYSEDLSDGQVYDSVRVVSPFRPGTAAEGA
jgi:predicted nucleic acid-binding protein